MGKRRNTYRILVGKTGEKSLARRRCRREVILRYALKEEDITATTGLIWLRMGTSSGLL
jgi:hypothetical protein